VLVEQSLNIAAELCERAVFLEKGQVKFEGKTPELLERDDIARAVFLGDAQA
jgi:ABC-type branched-subunit amino acid transport system ATPase component